MARRTIKLDKWEACLIRIAEKGKISKTAATRLLQEVAERGEAMRQTGMRDPFVTVAAQLAADLKETARKDAIDAARNAALRKQVLAEVKAAGGVRKANDVLRSLLHGTNIGGRDSVQARWRGIAAGWQGLLGWQIRKAGAIKAALRGGEFDRDVSRTIGALQRGEAVASKTPAQAVGKAIWQMLDAVRDRLNAAGARIGDATDYVMQTMHDPQKMRAAAGPRMTPEQAFEAWWKITEPRLAAKTFDTVMPEAGETMNDARRRFGRSVYSALVSGIHKTPDGAFGLPMDERGEYIPPAFEGSRNVARKLSQKRVLYWKNDDAWHEYMQAFGTGHSLVERMMITLEQSARHLALMERLGTNPTGNFNQILRQIETTYRDADLDGTLKFTQNQRGGLEAVMAHLDGNANRPVNQMWARITASLRTWEAVSYLGGVGITHFASIWPTVTSELRHHGVSRLYSLGKLVGAMAKGPEGHWTSAERQEMAAQLGAYSAGLTRDMLARWQPEDPIPGKLAAMASTFMKWTAIHYVFDNSQAAVREVAAEQLARYQGKAFGELDAHLSQMLGKYGIGQAEWDLLRAVSDLPKADGMAFMTPKDALRVDAAAAESLLRSRGMIGKDAAPETIARAVKDLRNELSDKLYSYYGDTAAHSTVTSGVRERAMVLGQARPATVPGELTRFVAQFKMWPLAAMHQVIGREIYMSLSKGEAAWNLGILAALSMSAGYLRMVVNDVATGRPIRDPTHVDTMAAALAQGGGVGLLGDFLFGEVNRFEGGLVGTLAGPQLSDTDQLIKIFGRWRKGEAGWPDLAHFAVRHVPFANLVYLKGMLDYMLWYHLYEAASPGWWERTNRRLIREQGRAMTGYVPGQGVPWTPWAIGTPGRQSQAEPATRIAAAPPARGIAAPHIA